LSAWGAHFERFLLPDGQVSTAVSPTSETAFLGDILPWRRRAKMPVSKSSIRSEIAFLCCETNPNI